METRTTQGERRPGPANTAAVGFVLLSGLLYVVGYSLSKALVADFGLTAVQVTFLRCALVLLATGIAALGWPGTGVTWGRVWRPARAWEQRAAAAALVASTVLSILGYGLMPVTEASALGFTAPLLVAALGGLLLRERVSLNRWLGIGVGFAGMLLVVRPGAAPPFFGIAASLGGAAAYAAYQVLVRRLRGAASSLDISIQVSLVGAVLLAGAMPVFWSRIGWGASGVVLVFTLVQTAGLVSMAAALRRSAASRLAPWQFSGLLWAMLLDAAVFGGLPPVGSLAGGALIVTGGLLAQDGFSGSKRAG